MTIKCWMWTGLAAALVVGLLTPSGASAQATEPAAVKATQPTVRTAAIFVKNRAKEVDDAKVTALEDLIVSRVTDQGMHIVSREDVINAVASFADAGPNKGDKLEPGAKLDSILSNNTSALRLSQNLGADYLLVASITTYGSDVREYHQGDVHTKITEATMRVSYKLLDGVMGGSLTGDVVTATAKDLATPNAANRLDLVNKLLDEASLKLADAIGAKVAANKIRAAPAGAKMAQFTINVSMADLAVPEIIKTETGEYQITANRYRIEAMAANVILDGVVLGSTPGPFTAGPGLHKIRVSRELCKDYEQTINIRDGLNLNVAMTFTPEGYARWRENIDFLQRMKDTAKFSDAEVKRIEAIAKMFEQSGYRIDRRSDVTSDTKVDAKINGTSLWPEVTYGRDGYDGRDGRDGKDGKDAQDGK